jgi:hypothetical protein
VPIVLIIWSCIELISDIEEREREEREKVYLGSADLYDKSIESVQ